MSEDILSDLGVTRAERRKLIRAQAKRLGPFEFEERVDLVATAPAWCSRLFASGRYWIQERPRNRNWLLCYVGRHDKAPGLTWSELQRIKCAVYGDRWAVQCYPPADEVTDVANIYWLFVAPDGWLPEWQRVERLEK